MVLIITQETFDAAVRENIKEFDLSPEEALSEAIIQFKAQGVDLTNIIQDFCYQRSTIPLLSKAIINIKKIGVPMNDSEEESLMNEINILKMECKKGLAQRVRAGKEGAYDVLLKILEITHKRYLEIGDVKDGHFISLVLVTLTALMDTQPDLLDDRGINYIKSGLENYMHRDVLCKLLKWTRTCCILHEMNKEKMYAAGIGDAVNIIISSNKNNDVLINCLQLIRKFTMDDDIRVEFSKRYERTRGLANNLLPTLLVMVPEFNEPPVVGELLLTISSLLVCEPLCLKLLNFIPDLMRAFALNYDKELVVKNAAILMTAATGSDHIKHEFMKRDIVSVTLTMLSVHSTKAAVCSCLMQAIGALTRREAAYSQQFLDNGAAEAIVECMFKHENDPELMKFACRAIRDMVARYRDQNCKFHELGVEELLKRCLEKFDKTSSYELRAALRDLDCDVVLDEQWTGTGVQLEL